MEENIKVFVEETFFNSILSFGFHVVVLMPSVG